MYTLIIDPTYIKCRFRFVEVPFLMLTKITIHPWYRFGNIVLGSL